MAKTVLELFDAEQERKLNKSKIIEEINNYVNDKTGKPSVNELLNFYLKNQKGEQPLAKVTGGDTVTLCVSEYEGPYGRGDDRLEIIYYRHVEDENPSKSFEIKFEHDSAGNILVDNFDYENVTVTEIKELINLILYGKRNVD